MRNEIYDLLQNTNWDEVFQKNGVFISIILYYERLSQIFIELLPPKKKKCKANESKNQKTVDEWKMKMEQEQKVYNKQNKIRRVGILNKKC